MVVPEDSNPGLRLKHGGLTAQEGIEGLSRLYRDAFGRLIMIALVSVACGVILNVTGHKEWNFVLAMASIILYAFAAVHPKPLLVAFGFGASKGLPNFQLEAFLKELAIPDFQLGNVLSEGGRLVWKYLKIVAHGALFLILTFGVLGLFELRQAEAVVPFFVFLIGMGIWSICFQMAPKWYKRITGAILLFGVIASVIGAYRVTHPQDATLAAIDVSFQNRYDEAADQEAQRIQAKINGHQKLSDAEWHRWNDLQREKAERSDWHGIKNMVWYRKYLELTVTNLKTQRVCGIRSGHRDFKVNKVTVTIAGSPYELSDFVRLNGGYKDGFYVGADGCVDVSFRFNAETLKKQFDFGQKLILTIS